MSEKNIRIGFEEVKGTLEQVLLRHGFSSGRAEMCARLFSEASLDGIYSHGLNRFPQFIGYVRKGFVVPGNEPSPVDTDHNFERWDGNRGPGNLNAWFCMERAIGLARKSGTGIAALRNTNHWMRGGTYGLQAARQNCLGICMTNTTPNMPPWGGRESRTGNNPFIIAVPHDPYPVLLDMAMSQYSYGKMEILAQQGELLSHEGGLDKHFEPTRDPGQILESGLALPMGYWKGSGMAIMLDLLVALLSRGMCTTEIGNLEVETRLSQLFIAFDLDRLAGKEETERIVRTVLDPVTGCPPAEPGKRVAYPGLQTWKRRQENEKKGIPVNPGTWQKIMNL